MKRKLGKFNGLFTGNFWKNVGMWVVFGLFPGVFWSKWGHYTFYLQLVSGSYFALTQLININNRHSVLLEPRYGALLQEITDLYQERLNIPMVI